MKLILVLLFVSYVYSEGSQYYVNIAEHEEQTARLHSKYGQPNYEKAQEYMKDLQTQEWRNDAFDNIYDSGKFISWPEFFDMTYTAIDKVNKLEKETKNTTNNSIIEDLIKQIELLERKCNN